MVWRERTIEQKMAYPLRRRSRKMDSSRTSGSHFLKINLHTSDMPVMDYPMGWSPDMDDFKSTRQESK